MGVCVHRGRCYRPGRDFEPATKLGRCRAQWPRRALQGAVAAHAQPPEPGDLRWEPSVSDLARGQARTQRRGPPVGGPAAVLC